MISELYMVVYMISELFWQFEEIMSKNITLSEQFRNHVEKYHTVRAVPKSCRKIPLSECDISYIISELFWQCGIFLHDFGTLHVCVHDFGTVLTVWYFSTWFRNRNHVGSTTLSEQFRNHVGNTTLSEQFRNPVGQCDILRHNFWTVLTVWYFSTWLRNCSESVVFFDMISELFWQCGIFRHDFG
jgi:hypothetical protein